MPSSTDFANMRKSTDRKLNTAQRKSRHVLTVDIVPYGKQSASHIIIVALCSHEKLDLPGVAVMKNSASSVADAFSKV